MAGNFFKDNADLQFYMDKGIDWAPLVDAVERGRFGAEDGFKDTAEAVGFYRDVAEMFGEFVANEVAPHREALDREGVRFDAGNVELGPTGEQIFKKVKQLDLHGLVVPRELGGMNAPMMLHLFNSEMFARGDVSLMTHHGFHGGMAAAMLFYSVAEGSTEFDPETLQIKATRWQAQIQEIAAGKAWASMDLTEPNAGSDLAQVRTKALLGDDGVWRISGQKIFITSGHARWHFVIARTEDEAEKPGLEGLSMFLVEAFRPKRGKQKEYFATFERVEEKLGHHASPTVAISYDNTPGELIGERGQGFKLMLLLMNNARIALAFESLGVLESAHRMAAEYAAERPSMGKTIDRHEMIADYLDEMRTDIQGLRALGVYASIHEELAQRYDIAANVLAANDEVESQRYRRLSGRHKAKARRVTPLAKAFGSERAVFHAQRCIQIHGGVGYTKEYGAEKLLRDAMVLPIYEGTTQIQALMAMKDSLMGIMKDPAAFLSRLAQWRWRSVSARDPLERRVAKLKSLSLSAQQHLMQRTATDKLKGLAGKPITAWPKAFTQSWDPKRDFAFAMLHAERLLWLLTDEAIAGILLEQAQQFPERRELLERWLERAEPRARMHHDQIHTTGDRILAKLAEAEADTADRATA
ncbi:MAG: acyl-CoA dehydrogenase family protein [Myxococcales bacterium]|nr:acyl-CoA dehydrogenase family protein [Myxococcales bacterium]